jgi:Lrp/AsnC family transcriptional regulator, leucine-responsive regulatory protein
MIDGVDAKILNILQGDARTPNSEIARRLGMAPSAIFERTRKLEARGIIQGYEARINPQALDLGLLAFVFVRADERLGSLETSGQLAQLPGVQEVHHIAGEDCYLVKVRARDTAALGRLLRDSFGAIPTVRSTRTTIVLTTVCEAATLPLPAATEEEEEAVNA